MRQCFKNFPANFQSRPMFLAVFFSKRVMDDDDRRKIFFLALRGEDGSLIYRVGVTVEYRSSVPTRDITAQQSAHSASSAKTSAVLREAVVELLCLTMLPSALTFLLK